MSYPQFGYTFPAPVTSSAALAAASQLLAPCSSALTTGLQPTISPGNPACATVPDPCSRPVTASSTSDTPPTPSPAPPGHGAGAATLTGSGTPAMYSASSLLSYGPRVLPEAMYPSAYAAQGYMPFGTDPSAFYSPLGDNTEAWRSLSQSSWPYDPTNMAAYPYSTSYGGLDVRRKNATRESTSTLKAWLYEHIKNPYPTKGEKIMLAIITKMTLTQVSTWFANARRRLKKENKMQWSPRNRTGDEDEKNSDDDDDDDDGHCTSNGGDKTGDNNNNNRQVDGEKTLADDEDIIVDGGADDSLLSPSGRDVLHNKFDDVAGLLCKDSSGLFSPLNSSLTTPPGGRGLMSPIHKPSTSVSPHAGRTSASGGAKIPNDNSAEKPRIWSLADVATSSTPPPLRDEKRSPLSLHLDQHQQPNLGPAMAAGASSGLASALGCGSAHSSAIKMPHAHTAFSAPSSHSTFQPWVNGAFSGSNHQGANSSGLSNYGYTPLGSHHPLGGAATSVMSGAGALGNGLNSRGNLACAASHENSLSSLTTAYSSKLQSNVFSEKNNLPQIPAFNSVSGETNTAFKPVPKRL